MEPLAEGLLLSLDDIIGRISPHAERALDWLRVAAQPPPGVELRATDGTLFTGLALFERNKIIVMIAVASGQGQASCNPIPLGPAPSRYAPSSSTSYGSSRRLFEEEQDDPGDGWPPDPYRR